MRLASDNGRARRCWKHLSWRSRWIILCTLEQRTAVSCEISRADRYLFAWLVQLIEHKVLHCYVTNVVYRCLVVRQYPSCGFSSADCRCFQLSNHCQEIHLMSFAHHTVLTDRDFKSESHLPVKFSWFCLIFLQIFRSRQFPNVK